MNRTETSEIAYRVYDRRRTIYISGIIETIGAVKSFITKEINTYKRYHMPSCTNPRDMEIHTVNISTVKKQSIGTFYPKKYGEYAPPIEKLAERLNEESWY